jgi:hypothetical protein
MRFGERHENECRAAWRGEWATSRGAYSGPSYGPAFATATALLIMLGLGAARAVVAPALPGGAAWLEGPTSEILALAT